jgi:hypothetical protein
MEAVGNTVTGSWDKPRAGKEGKLHHSACINHSEHSAPVIYSSIGLKGEAIAP